MIRTKGDRLLVGSLSLRRQRWLKAVAVAWILVVGSFLVEKIEEDHQYWLGASLLAMAAGVVVWPRRFAVFDAEQRKLKLCTLWKRIPRIGVSMKLDCLVEMRQDSGGEGNIGVELTDRYGTTLSIPIVAGDNTVKVAAAIVRWLQKNGMVCRIDREKSGSNGFPTVWNIRVKPERSGKKYAEK